METKVNNIIEIIKNIIKNPHVTRRIDTVMQDIDIQWGFSIFLSKLLYSSKIINKLTNEQLDEIINKYNETNGTNIEFDQLLEKCFLRVVLGQIEIPQGVAWDHYHKKDESYPKHEIALVTEIKKAKYGSNGYEQKKLVITHDDLNIIYNNHKNCFKQMPELVVLEKNNIIKKHNSDYLIPIRGSFSSDNPWFSLANKVAGLLWEELFQNDNIINNNIFDNWFEKVINFRNFYDAPAYMSNDAQSYFFEIVGTRIIEERDLLGWEKEPQRVFYEFRGAFNGDYQNAIPVLNFNEKTLLEYYYWWHDSLYSNILDDSIIDGCRKHISTLIFNIARYDNHLVKNRIIEFLKMGHQIPFMSNIIPDVIYRICPQIIPLLFDDLETMSLGAILLERVLNSEFFVWERLNNDIKTSNEIKLSIWNRCIDLILEKLVTRFHETSWEVKSKAIFDVILYLAKKSFKYQDKENLSSSNIKLLNILNSIEESSLNKIRNCNLNDYISGNIEGDIIVIISPYLLNSIKNNINETIRVGNPNIPFIKLKLLFWLLGIAYHFNNAKWNNNRLKYPDVPDKEVFINTMIQSILEYYYKEIEREKYTISGREGEYVISWSYEPEIIDTYPWDLLTVILNKNNQLEKIINLIDYSEKIKRIYPIPESIPDSISSEEKTDSYYGKVRLRDSWAHKIRLHLKILLNIYEGILTKKQIYDIDTNIDDLLLKIEKYILEIVLHFNKDNIQSGKIDIFSGEYERALFYKKESSIFPHFAKLLNNFNDRLRNDFIEKYIKIIDEPNRMAQLSGFIISEKSKKIINKKLKKFEVEKYLETLIKFDDIEHLLINITNSKNCEIAKKIIKYGDGDENIKERKNWIILSYRIKIAIAYYENDIESFNKINIPMRDDIDDIAYRELEKRRDFFIGLLKLETEPTLSYGIFDRLYNENKSQGDSAINRFAAKIKIADNYQEINEKRKILQEALDEWISAEKELPGEEIIRVINESNYNKLYCYYSLKRYQEFELLWNNLEEYQRMQLENIDIACKCFIEQRQFVKCENICDKAKEYHIDHEAIKKIEIIQKSIHQKQKKLITFTRPRYSNNYKDEFLLNYNEIFIRIKDFEKEDLVKIVSSKSDIADYILTEIIDISELFLEKIFIFKEKIHEDHYNDIFEILLKRNFHPFYWEVSSQNRSGYSQTGNDAGELDIKISYKSNYVTAIEAFRLETFNTNIIRDHIIKLISKYNSPGAKYLYILVYFEGDNFEDVWEKYKSNLSAINYGERFDKIEIRDISIDLNLKNNIRVSLASHNDLNIFHIFLNFINQ
jgi:hypothetical protein